MRKMIYEIIRKESVTAQELILDNDKDILIMVLKQKFGKLPKGVVTDIRGIQDKKKIRFIVKSIFKLDSLEQVKNMLT